MKQFGQFSDEVRSKAIDNLANRGIHTWDAGFDQNSEIVLEACRAVEENRDVRPPKEVAMYTWTPEMVAAYHNHRDGTPGKRLTPYSLNEIVERYPAVARVL